MSFVDRVGGRRLYRALWGLQGSNLPDALRQHIVEFIFSVFPFQEELDEYIVHEYTDRDSYDEVFEREVILIKTIPLFAEYNGIVLPLCRPMVHSD